MKFVYRVVWRIEAHGQQEMFFAERGLALAHMDKLKIAAETLVIGFEEEPLLQEIKVNS